MLTLLLFLLHRTIKTRTCELQPHKSNFPLWKPADNVHSMSVFFIMVCNPYRVLCHGDVSSCSTHTLQYAVCVSSLPLNINILLKNISLVGRRNKRQGNSAAAQHLEAPPLHNQNFVFVVCATRISASLRSTMQLEFRSYPPELKIYIYICND